MITFNLKEIMDDKEISIQDLSDMTNLSRNTISQMYNGNSKGIQFETLDKLLENLSLNVQELIIFNSSKEIEKFNIELKDILQTGKEINENWEPIYRPHLEQQDDESDSMYEDRLNSLNDEEEIIGHSDSERYYKKCLLSIEYEDFNCNFPIFIKYVVEGIKNKEEVKSLYESSEYYDGEDFDRVTWMHQCATIFVDGFEKNIKQLNYDDYQIKIIKKKTKEAILAHRPVEYLNFIEKYDVVDEKLNIVHLMS